MSNFVNVSKNGEKKFYSIAPEGQCDQIRQNHFGTIIKVLDNFKDLIYYLPIFNPLSHIFILLGTFLLQ